MKNKKILFPIILITSVFTIAISVHPNKTFFNENLGIGYADYEYTIALDKNDDVVISDSNATYIDRYTTFEYKNVSNSDNGHIVINKAGYITNTSPIVDGLTIEIAHSLVAPNDLNLQNEYGFGGLFIVFDTHPIDNPFSYSRENEIIESVDGLSLTIPNGNKYFALASYNTCDIDFINITYRCGYDGYEIDNSSFTLNVIGTNDIHGQGLPDGTTNAGLANASYKINTLKNTYKYNLLLDQGDLYQGSIDSYNTDGRLMDEFLLSSGYDSTIIGNHEWDYGYLGKDNNGVEDHNNYFKNTHVSLLGNNVLYNGNEVDWNITMLDENNSPLRGTKLVERHGVKIGLIGMAGDYASSISGDLIIGYDFLSSSSEIKQRTIEASNALKALGADFIILQIHDGSKSSGTLPDCYDIELSTGGYVDLVLESHTHYGYSYVDEGGVYHIQSNGSLKNMYNVTVDFTYNSTSNEWEHVVNAPTFHYASSLVNYEDELMDDIHYWYSNRVFGYEKNKIIAVNAPALSKDEIISLVAETLFEVIDDEYGSEYKVIYGGGYLNVRGNKTIDGGVLTFGDINTLLPFDNDIQLCRGLWSEFKARFINNSSYVGYTPSYLTNDGDTYYIDGVAIEDNDYVYFATDSYSTQYWLYGDGVGKFDSCEVVANYTAKHFKFVRHVISDKFSSNYITESDIPNTITSSDTNVEITLNKTYTLSASVDRGNSSLFYSTSNENIAVVDHFSGVIKTKNIGTCSIKVTSLVDASVYTSININVVEVTEEDTNKYGTLTDPLSVSETIAIYDEECQTSGTFSQEKIYVTGIVVVAPTNVYTNYVSKFYIADSVDSLEEDYLYVYSASYGGTYGTTAPIEGDTIILYGYLTNYNGTREMAGKSGDYVWVVA